MAKKELNYELKSDDGEKTFEAPKLPYRPRDPKRYRPKIGLIGCGGITASHLQVYKDVGYNVVAFCDKIEARAQERRDKYFPDADVYTDSADLLRRDDIEVVDLATHPKERAPLIEASLKARKHVLSQKPFVLDLEQGKKFAELADKMGVRLAINQNGRWAPHFSYLRHAVAKGLIGDVLSVHLSVHWDHDWITTTPFNNVKHIVLYDFAIHWFDILMQLSGGRKATRVFASETFADGQKSKQQLLAQAIVEFEGAQASLVFDAFSQFGRWAHVHITGTKGTLHSTGSDISKGQVSLTTKKGVARPILEGTWFTDGFHGTMGELLCAIEEKRQPITNALDNLRGLEVCFAALKAVETGKPQTVGSVRKVNVE